MHKAESHVPLSESASSISAVVNTDAAKQHPSVIKKVLSPAIRRYGSIAAITSTIRPPNNRTAESIVSTAAKDENA